MVSLPPSGSEPHDGEAVRSGDSVRSFSSSSSSSSDSHLSYYSQQCTELFDRVVQNGENGWDNAKLEELLRKSTDSEDGNSHPQTLLHMLVSRLHSESKAPQSSQRLLDFAKEVVRTDPALLHAYSDEEHSTPLRLALEKLGDTNVAKVMKDFVRGVCDTARDLGKDGTLQVERAINYQKNGQTCLHFVAAKGFDILEYMLECSAVGTLTEKCGHDENTVLHVAVNNITAIRSKWVEALVKKNRQALLISNREGCSPYSYFIQQQKSLLSQKAEGKSPTTDDQPINRKSKPEPSVDLHKNARDNPSSNNRAKIDQSRERRQRRADNAQKRMAKIEAILRDACLKFDDFSDIATALYGRIEEVSNCRFNLLEFDLSHNFERLGYKQLNEQLAFVGVKAPRGKPTAGSSQKHIIEQFFEWLRETKHVKSILKVEVKDDPENPCTDRMIELALEGFQVQYLDWDRIDLASSTIRKVSETVRWLRLYTTGCRAVLDGWAHKEGLPALAQLKKVEFVVKTRSRTPDIEGDIKTLTDKLCPSTTPPVQLDVKFQWDVDGQIMERPPDPATSASTRPRRHNWFKVLDGFLGDLFNENELHQRELYPKVCLIDDGAKLEKLDYGIEDGAVFDHQPSFTAKLQECFPSTEGHGTVMAQTIFRICPYTKLYIARLGKARGRGKFTARDAAQAIRWAVKNEVHIISMSWTIDEASDGDITDLTSAIDSAKGKTLIFCAVVDEGMESEHKRVYPYDCAKDFIKRIGASDEYGTKLTHVSGHADYYLPADAPTHLPAEVKGTWPGSSNATALATGLAALILFCHAVSHGDPQAIKDMCSPGKMDHVFGHMLVGTNYVSASVLFEADAKLKKGRLHKTEIRDRIQAVVNRCQAAINTGRPKSANQRNNAGRQKR